MSPQVSSHNEAKENVDDSSQEAVDHANGRELDRYGTYDMIEITEDDCCDGLGFSFPPGRNGLSSPSSSSSGLGELQHQSLFQCHRRHFRGFSRQRAGSSSRCCHLSHLLRFRMRALAPWSEEVGRWLIMGLSLFVNIWQLPAALARSFGPLIVGRAWAVFLPQKIPSPWLWLPICGRPTPSNAPWHVIFSSVGGSVLGPIVGGFVEACLSCRW